MSKMLWSMVSKAAERSRRHRQDNFCDPIALMTECIGGLFLFGTGAEVSWVRTVSGPKCLHTRSSTSSDRRCCLHVSVFAM